MGLDQLMVLDVDIEVYCDLRMLWQHFHHFSAHPGFNVNICKVVLEQVITLWLDEDEI